MRQGLAGSKESLLLQEGGKHDERKGTVGGRRAAP